MTPGRPPATPPLFLFDSDVLLQLLVSGRLSLLRLLKTQYGIQPCFAEAVNGEFSDLIELNPKFRARREQGYKAIRNGSLVVATRQVLAPIHGNASASALVEQAEAEGLRLYNEVGLGRGEAYSIAAANCYGSPVLTNDTTALSRLVRANEKHPEYCLRFWDLLAFANQAGHLDDGECDRVRQELAKADERTLKCFTGRSYVDGLPEFFPRLVDSTRVPLTCGQPQGRFDKALRILPLVGVSAPAHA